MTLSAASANASSPPGGSSRNTSSAAPPSRPLSSSLARSSGVEHLASRGADDHRPGLLRPESPGIEQIERLVRQGKRTARASAADRSSSSDQTGSTPTPTAGRPPARRRGPRRQLGIERREAHGPGLPDPAAKPRMPTVRSLSGAPAPTRRGESDPRPRSGGRRAPPDEGEVHRHRVRRHLLSCPVGDVDDRDPSRPASSRSIPSRPTPVTLMQRSSGAGRGRPARRSSCRRSARRCPGRRPAARPSPSAGRRSAEGNPPRRRDPRTETRGRGRRAQLYVSPARSLGSTYSR